MRIGDICILLHTSAYVSIRSQHTSVYVYRRRHCLFKSMHSYALEEALTRKKTAGATSVCGLQLLVYEALSC
jgi:hypothetical protein